MPRFRKKPVEVDAIRWTGDNTDEIIAFTGPDRIDVVTPAGRPYITLDPEVTALVYDVLHSTWVGVKTGQWIIRGVKGELYPCADDVFAETYEPAVAAEGDL